MRREATLITPRMEIFTLVATVDVASKLLAILWYFPGGVNTASFGVGYTANYNILSSLVEDGSTFDIDFTSEQASAFQGLVKFRSKSDYGSGMGGKTDLLVNYQIWVIQAPAPVTLKSFNVSKINSQSFLQWVVTSESIMKDGLSKEAMMVSLGVTLILL